MSLSLKNVAMIAGITMVTMFALNQLAARSPQARNVIRGAFAQSV